MEPPQAAIPEKQITPAETQETLTIEEPATAPAPAPAATTTTASSTTQPVPVPKRNPPRRTDSRPAEEPPNENPPAVITTQAPPLEPASPAVTEDKIRTLQGDVRRRIAGLAANNGRGFGDSSTATDRQTLEDARSFLTQSEEALRVHDLLKAGELVDKASLLLQALEQKP